jgi:hypothetical protein
MAYIVIDAFMGNTNITGDSATSVCAILPQGHVSCSFSKVGVKFRGMLRDGTIVWFAAVFSYLIGSMEREGLGVRVFLCTPNKF